MYEKIFLGLATLIFAGLLVFVFYEHSNLRPGMASLKRQFGNTFYGSPKICIQPFNGVDTAAVAEVKRSIKKYYGFEVKVLAPIALPESARTTQIAAFRYYRPSANRFRADTLIRHLRNVIPLGYDYILGITASDISCTKKRDGKIKDPTWMYTDWGIFGLGFCPGRSCVVSTYRLGRDTYDQEIIRNRLRKVANHELGHNLGLPHCPNPRCFMQDAMESMSTIDREPESLCGNCRAQIGLELAQRW
ncbi:MAG: hypothetical protein HC880_01525 [Bacteroidia bacterium]|nr:hypothetical protein [Bacteroidia bacterium]